MNMMSYWNRLVLLWMLATVLHLPMPVVDHDEPRPARAELTRNEFACPVPGLWDWIGIDVDYILVGCSVPDDLDDGPVDPVPSRDVQFLGAFPLFVKGEIPATVGIYSPLDIGALAGKVDAGMNAPPLLASLPSGETRCGGSRPRVLRC